MTEREVILNALHRIYGQTKDLGYGQNMFCPKPQFPNEPKEDLNIQADLGLMISDGYAGFFSNLEFDADGNLVRVSAWED